MSARPGRKDESRLRRWRVEKGYSLQEVGDIVGLDRTMLSLVERGQRQLTPRNRILFARRLGVPVHDLFEVEELPDPIDGVLTVPEVAQILRVRPRQVACLVHEGQLHGVGIGSTIRIPRVALERYLDSETTQTPGPLTIPGGADNKRSAGGSAIAALPGRSEEASHH